jgi:hypothetical protein
MRTRHQAWRFLQAGKTHQAKARRTRRADMRAATLAQAQAEREQAESEREFVDRYTRAMTIAAARMLSPRRIYERMT